MKSYKRIITTVALTAILALGVTIGMTLPKTEAAPANSARIYELRTYTCNDGKLDDLHARFANHTNTLFVKHNMTLIGYWTPAEGDTKDNTLIYIIGHESRDAAKENWKGFVSDPDWKAAYAASRKDGPIVSKVESVFMDPTDYSPLR